MTDINWSPTAGPEALRQRADMLSRLRAFFRARGVLEVETPLLSHHGTTEPAIESYRTQDGLWLHTSPEFAMKRLLAAGSGAIYQVCKVFRREELGRRHNGEFTLLEWYRPGWGDVELMAEVEALLRELLDDRMQMGEGLRLSYEDAFFRYLDLDPLQAPVKRLARAAAEHGIHIEMSVHEAQRDAWLELLMSQVIEPSLPPHTPVFITRFPASQASLARLDEADSRYAHRFELFFGGMELANGFFELTDPVEQARRFEQERRQRASTGQVDVPADANLLAALSHGLPDCSGVAMGVDRVLMLALGARDIREVIAFPMDRA
ncbi:MAG: EF-P lysine aminoacylase GenX [Gammaproteobacteria bacterium]|nr:EF-P lysine aminoacylase GenX [Gammaproteobacteria bacterium]